MESLSDLIERIRGPKPDVKAGGTNADGGGNGTQQDNSLLNGAGNPVKETYTIDKNNWYTSKPYGFKWTKRDGSSITMFLPINPSNLTITTSFATNVITTLYGTVEEHSDVRYYDISIEGTTGMAPRFVDPYKGEPGEAYSKVRESGRSTTTAVEAISAGGFFSKTLSALTQARNKAADLIDSGRKPKTGVYSENSGYVAFHNLYRFLLQYKKDAAGVDRIRGQRKDHPLIFFNYKDNNQYNVAVRNFTMRRSAENPMLYYYSIQLRGYNLKSIKSEIKENVTQRNADLGLDGVDSSSLLGNIKSVASRAKSVVGAVVGGINVLGR